MKRLVMTLLLLAVLLLASCGPRSYNGETADEVADRVGPYYVCQLIQEKGYAAAKAEWMRDSLGPNDREFLEALFEEDASRC